MRALEDERFGKSDAFRIEYRPCERWPKYPWALVVDDWWNKRKEEA